MSLKQAAKERLLWAIQQVVAPFGKLIMLVDPPSLKVISSCCALSDVLDEGIELIEVLTKRREPLRSKNVVCILSSDVYLDLLFKDFIPGKENYLGVFIMFNCHMRDDKILRKIAKNIDFNKILGCVELFLNFVTFESNIFYTQLHSIKTLYTTNNLNDYINSVTSKITSLCNVLNLLPNILYHTNTNTYTHTHTNTSTNTNSNIKIMICKRLKESINETLRGKNLKNCDLIIFDRSIDFTPLFIHEFSYQAFVYDLLNIPYCSIKDGVNTRDRMDTMDRIDTRDRLDRLDSMERMENKGVDRIDNCYEFKVVGMDRVERRMALLDSELDVLWCKYRHMHIQEVNTLVSNEIDKFKKSGSGKMSNMLEQIRNLPNLQYLIEKYWAHLNLTNECFEQVQKCNLIKIGDLEQVMATSLDTNKKHISHSKVFDKLVQILYEKSYQINSFQLTQGPDKKFSLQSRDHGPTLTTLRTHTNTNTHTNSNTHTHTNTHTNSNTMGGNTVGTLGDGNIGDRLDMKISAKDKIRLILIYLCNYNVGVDGLRELLSEIRLDDKSLQILQNIIKLLPILKNNDGKITHQLTNDHIINYYKKLNVEYDSSRYISYLIFTLQQFIKHSHHEYILSYDTNINTNTNTTTNTNSNSNSNSGMGSNSKSSNNVIERKIMDLKTFDVLMEKEQVDDRRKLIIYVLGGITFSECREIYKIMKKKHIDIYFGGDEILVPSQFLDYF